MQECSSPFCPGHDEHHDQGRQHHAQSGAHTARDPRRDPAHIGGDIDGEGAGRAFAHRDEIDQLLHGHPALLGHRALDEGDHGVAPAEGEGADQEKAPEQLKKDHSALLPDRSAIPRTALPMITGSALTFRIHTSTKAHTMTETEKIGRAHV